VLWAESTTVIVVARRYSEKRTYQLPDAALTARAESIARRALADATSPLYNGVRLHVSMNAAGGYEATGDDWDVVLSELTADGLVPTSTYVAFYPPVGLLLTSPPTIMSDRERATLNVDVVSDDEGFVRTSVAKVDRLITQLLTDPERDGPDAPVAVAAPAVPTTPSAAAEAPVAASPLTDATSPSWLARTWRDHAATLVVTVVGTVLAAALLVVLNIGG